MKRLVRGLGDDLLLEVELDSPNVRFRLGSESGEASIVETEPGVYSVLDGGRSREFSVRHDAAGSIVVCWHGGRAAVTLEDPRDALPASARSRMAGPVAISAPMPGKVIRVLVKEGEEVESGQGIVVVEAMKMQNELAAPRAGRVKSVQARDGDTVAAGQALAVLE